MASFNFTQSMAIVRGKQKTGKKSKQSKTKIMKNFLIVIMMLCMSNTIHAQNTKISPTAPDGGDLPVCPAGMCPTVNFFIEVFNFHKPRTNCETGFGLCIRFSSSVTCNYCNWKSSIKAGKVNVWAKLSSQVAEIHIPVSLRYEKGFEKTDMSSFEIEDKAMSFKFGNGVEKFAKAGTYPVSVIGDEYVINLNLY